METVKIDLLENYLSLYINHFEVLKDMKSPDPSYVILDIWNAPKEIKKDQIKGQLHFQLKNWATEYLNWTKRKHTLFTIGMAVQF